MTDTLQPLLDFALDIAWQAGRVTLGYFQTGIGFERKQDDSPVTRADRESEQTLRRLIQMRYPDHNIIGEEYGEQDGKSGLTWILDPIDGTKAFICGVPFYATLVALVDGDTPLVGVAHYPALNETVYAQRGGGCYWNGRRARVSNTRDLSQAVLLGSEIVYPAGRDAGWKTLHEKTWIQRTWGDSYGYSMVATGRADVMVDEWMAIWDCAPFGVILPEAGGRFTDWKGNATIRGGESIATNGILHDEVLAIVGGSLPS